MHIYEKCTALSMVQFLRSVGEAPKAVSGTAKELELIFLVENDFFRTARIPSNNAK